MLNPAQPRARHDLQRLLGIDPYEHQCQAVALGMERLSQHGSYGLFHEQGCGKSFSTLGIIGLLAERGLKTALVVCPSSVIGSWENEAKRCQFPVDVLALTGPVAKREAKLQRKLLERDEKAQGFAAGHGGVWFKTSDGLPTLIVVTNYEAVWRMEGTLKAARFGMVAADEAQKLKAPGSKQSRSMHRIGQGARYRMLITGTPTPESELDLYGIWRFADQSLFGTSYTNFKARYAHEIDCGSFRKISVRQDMVPELERIVHSRSHRVTKEDALDLPEQIDVTRPFDMSPKARKLYDQLAKDSLAQLEDEFGTVGEIVTQHVLTKLLRLQQITGEHMQLDGEEHVQRIESGKLAVLKGELESVLEAGGKAIVWHRFTAEGKLLRDLANKMVGAEQPHIDGSVPSGERGGMVRLFQEDPEARIFIAQVQAASTGITLTAANTAIYYSTSFSSGEHEQARARCHRIGQSDKVRHVYLVANDSIDEHVLEALRAKRSLAESFTDSGWKRFLGGK